MYKEKSFAIPELKGISPKNIEEHLKLYSGYVKHTNLILEQITELGADREKNTFLIGELRRRFGFEFDGMRNHEYYFKSFEVGHKELSEGSALKKNIREQFGSFERWLSEFKHLGMTRGIGWAILYFDPLQKKLLNAWIDEQHYGHLTGLAPILTLDMWEHSYVADYQPSGKKNYIEDFFSNINWEVIESNFHKAHHNL